MGKDHQSVEKGLEECERLRQIFRKKESIGNKQSTEQRKTLKNEINSLEIKYE